MNEASCCRRQVTTNKNVEWINAPGAWTFIVALIILGWLLASLFVDSGFAWTFVHLGHGVITYYLLHWNKGSPVQMDQVSLAQLSSGGAAASVTVEAHSRIHHAGLIAHRLPAKSVWHGHLHNGTHCGMNLQMWQ